METVKADLSWSGPDHDVLTLFVVPRPEEWTPVSIDGESSLFVVADRDDSEISDKEEEVAGAEIVGFLGFEEWKELPDLNLLWQVGDGEPLPLEELLKRKQRELRA
ncbi:MAG: hypothetical protein M3R38_16630 [Actinomycetota bacterium]|nr:hypothetical protein [Actinomycetota bacterium]